jgi:FkbM family methyltransferase
MEAGTFELEETALIRSLLAETACCVNVGANIGYYCCIAASMGKRAYAFEPMSLNLQYMLKNIEANGWTDVIHVFPLALAGKRGSAKMYGGGTGASLLKGWAGVVEKFPTLVATSTLDGESREIKESGRWLIIVDIEGAEYSMLLGGSDTLVRSPRPIWMVEVSIAEHQPAGISINPTLLATFNRFWNTGYEAWTTSRPYRQVLRPEVESIVAGGPDTLKTHNFLFVEANLQGFWRS